MTEPSTLETRAAPPKVHIEESFSELTVRALLSGLVVGSLIGASNVCIG
jgi:uncharacterized oligopeptide transporter (OPT) family protein